MLCEYSVEKSHSVICRPAGRPQGEVEPSIPFEVHRAGDRGQLQAWLRGARLLCSRLAGPLPRVPHTPNARVFGRWC